MQEKPAHVGNISTEHHLTNMKQYNITSRLVPPAIQPAFLAYINTKVGLENVAKSRCALPTLWL